MSPSFEVRVSARAERDLERLPEKVAAACVEFIFGPLAAEPHRLGGMLRGKLAGMHSARRGSYRIVYRIVGEKDTPGSDPRRIDIVHIDHRGDVYR